MQPGTDYLIVGAGSAGAALAARLSENPTVRVRLLEAGIDYRSADTPEEFHYRNVGIDRTSMGQDRMARRPEFWWPNVTARRTRVQEPRIYRRGRGVGGSSTVNGLAAIRGIPDDFDGWAAAGAAGWSFDDVLPAFNRLESDYNFPDRRYHGADGPIPVYREAESGWGGVDRAVRDAALALGHPWSDDHNAPDATGVSPFAMNIRDDIRVSTNDGYLEPNRAQDNLTIEGNRCVDRILFHGTKAIGVRLTDGESIYVDSGGEVIVCAGTVHTPAILMRSGIGPHDVLQPLGIDTIVDRPVGKGLQDHVILFVEVPVVDSARECLGDRPSNIVVRYSSGMDSAGPNDMMLLASNHNYWFGSELGGLGIQMNRVFSRGHLRISSPDPHVEPEIDLGLLSDERDRRRLEDGLDRARELFAQPAMAQICTGPPAFPDRSDLLHLVRDTMHIAGSCRMGSPGDPGSVLDPDCRVLGTDNLRVIDASITPEVPRANINLSTIMLAEHMAARMTIGPQQHRTADAVPTGTQ